MATIAVYDLNEYSLLDTQAMATVKGGAGEWVFGWIRPYVPRSQRFQSQPAIVNQFFDVHQYFADEIQIINQNQLINVDNTGAGSNINIALGQDAGNIRLGG